MPFAAAVALGTYIMAFRQYYDRCVCASKGWLHRGAKPGDEGPSAQSVMVVTSKVQGPRYVYTKICNTCTHTHVYIYIYIYIFFLNYIHIHVYAYLDIYIYICIDKYECICMYS